VVALEGCLNFRDLGGYPTRDGRRIAWRRLFRSDALHALTEADLGLLMGEGIGLSDVIDLRSSAELASEGRGRLEATPVAFHHTPLYDGAHGMTQAGATASSAVPRVDVAEMTLAERYLGLLDVAQAPIARIVAVLAGARGAAVYHCAAGKDRTGVISALLLGLLGVDDELIVSDYALTQRNIDAILGRLAAMDGYKGMLDALPPDTQHANPETMSELLALVDRRWGSFAGYARDAGIGDEVVQRLRARLLEAHV
jgi:protein tyrosine/serine phosphatase